MDGNITKTEFFYGKCIWAIAYCDNVREKINYLFNFFSADASMMYDALSDFLGENNYFLDGSARENLAALVRYLKSALPGNDYSKIDAALADNSFTLIDGFTLQQYEKRFLYDKAPSSLVDPRYKKRYFELLRSMLVNDMDIMISHSCKCDKHTFEARKTPEYLSEMLKYIGSVNELITDKPSILANDLFASRVNLVADAMEPIPKTQNTQKIYEMFKQRIR
jgi:hypothetical protein